VATSEATTNGGYVDLATPGPSVTVTVGASGIVRVDLTCDGAGNKIALMGVVVSGANTIAAADTRSFAQAPAQALAISVQGTASYLFTGLAAGATTFKAVYKSDGATTATFANRSIIATAY